MTGTWALDGGTLTIDWFAEAGRAPSVRALAPELQRWSVIAGTELRPAIMTAPRP